MVNQQDLRSVIGATAYDNDGDKIGKIGTVYYDDNTDRPKWITVHTGLFGTNESFIPLEGASVSDDRVDVAYDKARVKDAPNVSSDKHLSVEEEQQLYRHYGLDYGAGYGESGRESGYPESGVAGTGRESGYETTGDATTGTGRHSAGAGYAEGTERSAGHDTSGPNTDDAMTRSEEQLRVGTETREAGRARLRKHVVTEHEQVSVPVSREEVHVEREPITEANRGDAYDGAAISEEEHEVVLREERPVVDKEAVPVERVRLGTETHTDSETVGGEVRKEQIEFDGDETGRRDRYADDDATRRR
jgi:uncharacterized protein (TIGR02271 family)